MLWFVLMLSSKDSCRGSCLLCFRDHPILFPLFVSCDFLFSLRFSFALISPSLYLRLVCLFLTASCCAFDPACIFFFSFWRGRRGRNDSRLQISHDVFPSVHFDFIPPNNQLTFERVKYEDY
ncbi:hypothetical protein BJX63DRAFT_220264 [Aspergillus granulosus]|uniref:Uncharacterized protein n=1 Tax=Aspergillus granulosus TaxID=176169 RepID=A0ABR4I1F8_9EURO